MLNSGKEKMEVEKVTSHIVLNVNGFLRKKKTPSEKFTCSSFLW